MKIRSIGIIAGSLFSLLIIVLVFMLAHEALNKPDPFRFNPTPKESQRPIRVQQSFQGKIREAKELLDHQHYEKASLLLSDAITQRPDLLEPYLLLGQVYTETQQIEKLKNIIEILQKKFPGNDSISLLETRRLLVTKEFQVLMESFTANENSLTPDLMFYYATLLALQNNHEKAKEIYQQILTYDQEKEAPPVEEEVTTEAVPEESLVAEEPTQPETPPKTTETFISEQLQTKTEALLGTYKAFDLVNDGKNPHLFALFSKTLAQYRELHLAKAFAEESLKEDVRYIDAWVLRGYSSLLLGETESALKDLEYANEQAPERSNTHYFLGLAYYEVGRNKEAILYFEKVLQDDFEYGDSLREKLIQLYIEEKEYEKVIGLYGELLLENDNPKDHIPPLQMAIEVINRPEIALEFTKKLIQQNPSDFLSYNFHAWALIANQRFTEAQSALDTALELKPNNPGSYLYLGLLYEEQGKTQQALEAYKKSYEYGADGPEIGITRLAAEKHNQLLEQQEKPEAPEAPKRSANSP